MAIILRKISFLTVFLCFIYVSSIAQSFNWNKPEQLTGAGNQFVEAIATDEEENLFSSGIFNSTLHWQGTTIDAVGDNDLFLTKSDTEDKLLWLKNIGSIGNDEFGGLYSNPSGEVYITGTFFQEMQLEDITLQALHARAIFLLKYANDGSLIWAKTMDADGEKLAYSMQEDSDGNLYLTGTFGGRLQIEDQHLETASEQALFLLKLSANGGLCWMKAAGIEGRTVGQSLALARDESFIAISGTMEGKVAFAQDTLISNTNDSDAFLALYDLEGNAIWGRKTGGVLEQNNSRILVDATNRIYSMGDFAGVIALDNGAQIQANGMQDNNLYILAYTPEGALVWARSLGGAGFEYLEDAVFYGNNQLLLTGYFRDSISIDGLQVDAVGIFDAYVLGFDLNTKQTKWMETISGENIILSNTLAIRGDNILVGGGFRESATFDANTLLAEELYDAFIATLKVVSNHTSSIAHRLDWHIYPNPTSDYLHIDISIENAHFQLYSLQGLLMKVFKTKKIRLKELEEGLYYLREARSGAVKIISIIR